MELRRPFGIEALLFAGQCATLCSSARARCWPSGLRQRRAAGGLPGGGGLHHRRPDRLAGAPRGAAAPTRRRGCIPPGGPTGRWTWTTGNVRGLGRAIGGRVGCCVRLESFLEALDVRHGAFHDLGCRALDHGLQGVRARRALRRCRRRLLVQKARAGQGFPRRGARAPVRSAPPPPRSLTLDHVLLRRAVPPGRAPRPERAAAGGAGTRLRRGLHRRRFEELSAWAGSWTGWTRPASWRAPSCTTRTLARQRGVRQHDRQLPGRDAADRVRRWPGGSWTSCRA